MELGIDHTALCRYERGNRLPSADDLPLIADFLGISATRLARRVSELRASERSRDGEQKFRFLPRRTIETAAESDREKFLRAVGKSWPDFPRDRDHLADVLCDLQVVYDASLRRSGGSQIFAGLFPPGSYYRDTSGVIAVATHAARRLESVEVSEPTKTFHVLHEVGHFQLHWRQMERVPPAMPGAPMFCSSGDRSPLEFQANTYASAFLMPRQQLQQLLGSRKLIASRSEESYDWCRHFFVEPWMLDIRLKSLGIRVVASQRGY